MRKRFNALIKRKGLTLNDVAEKTGVRAQSISRALGRERPGVRTMIKLAKAVDMELDDFCNILYNGDQENFMPEKRTIHTSSEKVKEHAFRCPCCGAKFQLAMILEQE